MPIRRPRTTALLTVADVSDIVAFAMATRGEDASERLPFETAQREYARMTARDVARRDAALIRACVAGVISLSDLDAASSAVDIAAVEARLNEFIEEEGSRRHPRPRLRVVASRRVATQSDRTGVHPDLRLVPSSQPMPPAKRTGRGR